MRDLAKIRVRRRLALKLLAALVGGLAIERGRAGTRSAEAQVDLLTVSGGGVNVKQLPSPDGSSMAPVRESFSFDAYHAQCIIEDNPAAIALDTFSMGRLVLEPHSLFMAMYATEVSQISIKRGPGGKLVANLSGTLDCYTFAGTATVSVGSRTASEPAPFQIEAVDGGKGGGLAGDSFAFTVFFDPDLSPVNHAIFGPKPTFSGEMVAGEVTIAPPATRPVQG